MATSVVDQTKEDQTHPSMMAWRVQEGLPEKHTVEMQTSTGSVQSYIRYGNVFGSCKWMLQIGKPEDTN